MITTLTGVDRAQAELNKRYGLIKEKFSGGWKLGRKFHTLKIVKITNHSWENRPSHPKKSSSNHWFSGSVPFQDKHKKICKQDELKGYFKHTPRTWWQGLSNRTPKPYRFLQSDSPKDCSCDVITKRNSILIQRLNQTRLTPPSSIRSLPIMRGSVARPLLPLKKRSLGASQFLGWVCNGQFDFEHIGWWILHTYTVLYTNSK